MKASNFFNQQALLTVVITIAMMVAWPVSATPVAGKPAAGPLSEEAIAIFESGWEAAKRGDLTALLAARDQLASADPDAPVLAYLTFEAFRQQGTLIDEETMTRFLARHRHWSFHDQLETNWLRALGEAGQTSVIERYLDQTGQLATDATVRCHLASAQIAKAPEPTSEAYQSLIEEIASLWRVPHSQVDACDRVFTWWRAHSSIPPSLAWSRFEMTIRQGERSLAGYLQRYLEDSDRPWASRWLMMQRYPHRALSEARRYPAGTRATALIHWGLIKLARQDWARARGHWAVLSTRFDFSKEQQASIEREMALFQAVALDQGAVSSINALPSQARDDQILAWQARVAMVHGQWNQVLESIQAMSEEAKADERWRYWRGRALAQIGRPDAILAYASLSTEANYYGFLAAQKLDQPLSLCPEPLPTDATLAKRLQDSPEFQRAVALYQVGLLAHARWTWYQWLTHLPIDAQHQAARLAASVGWHDRAIATLANTGSLQAYEHRFPLTYRSYVDAMAERHGVDAALVFGLMRAESAMQPDAQSHVGARGLLQLMPATARAVARRQGQPPPQTHQLMDPEVNVALGVAHLAELANRFEGDWVKVAAAYNAGAEAVARWLARDAVPDSVAPDVWIETLPFYETRDYVPRVLAFATIYEWQLERHPRVLAAHVTKRLPATGDGFVCAIN